MACNCGKNKRRFATPQAAQTTRMRSADPIVAAASVGSYVVVASSGRKVRSFTSLPRAEVYAKRIGGTVLPES